MADATYVYAKPFSGGGLGDCKVAIIEFDGGNYIVGGLPIDFEAPIFACSDKGYALDFSTAGKMGIYNGETELTADNQVVGKVLLVFKGAY